MTGPGDGTARQVSASAPQGGHILSVLVRRTYVLHPSGHCTLAADQLPLREDVVDGDHPSGEVLLADTDLYPLKPMTDVVLIARACAPKPSTQFEAGIVLGDHVKRVTVIGDRVARIGRDGTPRFSQPAAVDNIPLRQDFAYGGIDTLSEAKHGNPYAALAPYLDPAVNTGPASPFAYLRNAAGSGFVVDGSANIGQDIALPNLEDPADLLTPERLVLGHPERWSGMPMPWTTGWMAHASFPRCSMVGIAPPLSDTSPPVTEVVRGLIDLDMVREGPIQQKLSPRFANGASLGLQIPHMDGPVRCRLVHVSHTHPVWDIKLPSERPEIFTDGRKGTFTPTKPVLQTLLIEPDAFRITAVWRGAALALRPYMPEELDRMPFRVTWP